ncbi:MAG: ATPase [Rhodobacterales bacterium]|nr:MAG: ATPase [Rhodobacterales bacterium]
MAMTESSGAACPGCLAAPAITDRSGRVISSASRDVQLSLPTVHCAACMATVENGLMKIEGVEDVRVNLTRKRATVRARPEAETETLVHELERLGYEAQPMDGAVLTASESDRTARDLMMRMGVAGFAMMNVMLLSISVWSGATDATRDLFHWISAAITLPAILFSAQPFFRHGWSAVRHGRLNMDVPISLAIILAVLMSVYETSQSGAHAYFDAALSLTFFLLAGRFLDQKMRSVARSAAAELSAMSVPTALKLTDEGPITVKAADLAVGDAVLVRAGMRVPVDGTITEGASELDRAILTGETDPVPVETGADVRAGELNLTGPLTVTAAAVGKDTSLNALADLVTIAEESKSRYNSLADRAARIYAPAVHLLALTAFLFWMWMTGGDLRHAMGIAVAVLIITCPCALGLAVPAVSTVASGQLFRRGLLVKHPTALERLAEVDAVIFDKTGTLTTGTPRLTTELPDDLLAAAGALADGSAHPRSQAVAQAARGLPAATVTDIREHPGLGVEGQWNGRWIRLGRAGWIGQGEGTVLAVQGDAPIALTFEDALRPGAEELVAALTAQGVPVTLLSGDAEAPVWALADKLGITDWQAGLMPEDKNDHIRARSEAGERVMMVGDGLNDVGALALAHVSLAPAQAIEATRVAADVVLTSSDIAPVSEAMRLGRVARRRILENFGLAACYNAVSIPVAFFGFASPLAAAIAMSTSSIVVSLNALRTR